VIGLRILVLVCLHFHAALSHGEDQGFEFCIKGFSLVVITAGINPFPGDI
jgi:hypothetical protein